MAENTKLRENLARERTHLANERTILAYVRTSLAFLLSGAVLIRYLLEPKYSYLALLSIAIGVAILFFGATRFIYYWKKIENKPKR